MYEERQNKNKMFLILQVYVYIKVGDVEMSYVKRGVQCRTTTNKVSRYPCFLGAFLFVHRITFFCS